MSTKTIDPRIIKDLRDACELLLSVCTNIEIWIADQDRNADNVNGPGDFDEAS